MPDGSTPLNLRLLGRAELVGADGAPVAFATKKTLLLLAVLAVNEGESMTRTALAETVWPGSSDKSGRDGLRNALSALRKVLPENSIEAIGDTIRLREGYVSWHPPTTIEEHEGEFMPGFEVDWCIDMRLSLRTQAAEDGIARAKILDEEGKQEQALALLERACAIDPFSQAAAGLRVCLLEKMGKAHEAVRVSDSFRATVLREMGVVVDLSQDRPAPANHPLVETAKWLAERNPRELMSFLAATRATWATLDVGQALSTVEGALTSPTESHDESRPEVEALFAELLWSSGRLDEALANASPNYEKAISNEDFALATQLGIVLTYGHLSKGEFKKSLAMARKGFKLAQRRGDPLGIADSALSLGIVLQHSTSTQAGFDMVRLSSNLMREHGSALDSACADVVLSHVLRQVGSVEQASEILARAKRILEAHGSGRRVAWALLGEAEIHEAIGDDMMAKDILLRLIKMGPEVGGHSLIAMANENLAMIDARFGELDQAAEGFARAKLYRAQLGTVPSVYERKATFKTRQLLKERLNPRDLQQAFRRAGGS